MAAKRVLVPIANGSEEIEAVTIIDTLRRAGAEVTVASVEPGLEVTCSRKVKLVADASIQDAAQSQYDCIALPGGMPGAERLRDCPVLTELLKKQKAEDRIYSAICASPAVVLETHGLIAGQPATAHPGFSDELSNQEAVSDRVVVSGKLVTSRGPGTSLEYALRLVEELFGRSKAEEVARPMVLPAGWERALS